MSKDWIERIFTRMLARYGSAWVNAWAGVETQAMLEDWGRVLDGVPAHMIAYGLDNLPDKPPIATQFRALCVQHPARPLPALEAPPADPARVAAALGRMHAGKSIGGRDQKQWARDLRDRELNHNGTLESGRKMTKAQRDMWRAALKQEEAA